MIASPCINICDIDQLSGLCIGCLRTLDEIARWASASDEQRQAILTQLPHRKSRRKLMVKSPLAR